MTAPSFPSATRTWARKLYRFSLLSFCLLASTTAAHATTYFVPTDYSTIQAAVNAASNGDTVLIAHGTYTGPGNVDIDLSGKSITVTSVNGAASTIIDCGGTSTNHHCAFLFHNGETATLSGLSIQNGYGGPDNGGPNPTLHYSAGVQVTNGSHLTLQNCVFLNDMSQYSAILVISGGLTMARCTVTGGDYGMTNEGGTVTLMDCNISGNTGVGVYNTGGSATLTNCTVTSNSQVNFFAYATSTLTNCTLAGNSQYGIIADSTSSKTLTNCLIYGNAYGVYPSTGSIPISYCDIQDGYTGTGNINADPKFVSSTDFHLQPGSPCVAAGTSAGAPAADLDGAIRSNPPTIGAYEGIPATATTTTLTSAQNPSIAGQSVTLTATVTANTGMAVPTGSVQFAVDGINAGAPVTLDNTGAAAHAAAGLLAGSHTVTAVYAPTGVFSTSTSSTLTQTVNPAFTPSYDALWTAGDGRFSVWEAALGGGFAPHDFDAVPGFTASALAVTSDSHAHVLMTATNGSINLADTLISTLGRDHNSAAQTPYGPFAGWTAQTLAAGPDGAIHVLWTSTSDQMSLWKVHPDSTYDHAEYGPYPGWTARFLSAAPDSTLRVLWTSTSGQASFWVMDAGGGVQYFNYGPYPDWTPSALATGPDGLSHITWNHAGDNLVSVWSLDDSGAFTFTNFGPYTDWTTGALAVGTDNTLHLGWSEPDGTASLWDVAAANPLSFTDALYGPFGNGWHLQSLSAAP